MESDELFEVQPVGAVAPEQRSMARQPKAAIPNFRLTCEEVRREGETF